MVPKAYRTHYCECGLKYFRPVIYSTDTVSGEKTYFCPECGKRPAYSTPWQNEDKSDYDFPPVYSIPFIPINKGMNFCGCPGIEAWFIKQLLAKYNYKVSFSKPDSDNVIQSFVNTKNGLKPLDRLYEYAKIVLLLIADLKQVYGKEYL